jgi:PD-(D/E)XK endonuclease
MLTTDQKGAIAEAAIASEATKLGIEVYRPMAEGGRFDMIFLLGERLVRVQCKWAPRLGDAVIIRCYSNRRAREGLRRRVYTADEIDAFAAYCPDNERCYYIPFGAIGARTQILLRLAPTHNNQRLGIHWAEDFEFAARLGRHPGAIAQLGERCHGMAEVAGSSPAGSTLFTSIS